MCINVMPLTEVYKRTREQTDTHMQKAENGISTGNMINTTQNLQWERASEQAQEMRTKICKVKKNDLKSLYS